MALRIVQTAILHPQAQIQESIRAMAQGRRTPASVPGSPQPAGMDHFLGEKWRL